MSTVTRPTPAARVGSPEVSGEMIWRASVEKYHEMIRAGIVAEDDPVELLGGWLILKMPKSPAHRAVTHLTVEALARIIPDGWYVDSQEPITTVDSEPEPDVTIIRGQTRDYLDRHPGPEDVALVVEVADTSLGYDRGLKKRIYARAGIATYWIVNLADRSIEVYSDPGGDVESPDFQEQHVYGPGHEVPVVVEGREIGRLLVRELIA